MVVSFLRFAVGVVVLKGLKDKHSSLVREKGAASHLALYATCLKLVSVYAPTICMVAMIQYYCVFYPTAG